MLVGLRRFGYIMANNADNRIKNSWGLVAFARMKGKMQVAPFVNENGEAFKSCVFTHPETGERSFVNFSSKLGELTPAEIVAQKADLQVIERVGDDGKLRHILCRAGESTWEDVDLGL